MSRDKQKPPYIFYQSAFDHQTEQDDNLPWQTPTFDVSWPFNHVI